MCTENVDLDGGSDAADDDDVFCSFDQHLAITNSSFCEPGPISGLTLGVVHYFFNARLYQ